MGEGWDSTEIECLSRNWTCFQIGPCSPWDNHGTSALNSAVYTVHSAEYTAHYSWQCSAHCCQPYMCTVYSHLQCRIQCIVQFIFQCTLQSCVSWHLKWDIMYTFHFRRFHDKKKILLIFQELRTHSKYHQRRYRATEFFLLIFWYFWYYFFLWFFFFFHFV